MNWRMIEKPRRLDYEKDSLSETYGKFYAEPFERGYGATIGNSLRRILLSSIPGAAVTAVKFEGVSHEFSTIEGCKEDVVEIILNLKGLKIRLHNPEGQKKVSLKVKGERRVTAADLQVDSEVEVINPDLHVATLTDEDASLSLEVEVNQGRGYAPAERNKREDMPIGLVPVDSLFSPVTKVDFSVEATRVGQMTDYDRLIVEVWTDGRVKPEDALANAAKLLKDLMYVFINFEDQPEEKEEEVDEEKERIKELLKQSVEEMELSVRSSNCLQNANIRTIGDLVAKQESEMLKYRNFGRKSINEIKEVLMDMGLQLGMNVGDYIPPAEGEKVE